MTDQPRNDQPVNDALARMQSAQTQYMTAIQEVWASMMKSYNDSCAAFLKEQQERAKAAVNCEPAATPNPQKPA